MTDYYLLQGHGGPSAQNEWRWNRPQSQQGATKTQLQAQAIWKKQVANHRLAWTDEVTGHRYYTPASLNVFRLALVGHGSSIAYYLRAMPREFKHSNTVLFGVVDAWDRSVRGDGFINHEPQQVAHWGKTPPSFSTDYLERQAFVQMNQEAFDEARRGGARVVKQEVTAVRRRGDLIELSTQSGSPILAAKAILGTGAGPHFDFGSERGPVLPSQGITATDVPKEQRALQGKVLHLDDFMVLYPRTPEMQKSLTHREPERNDIVIVHGPNAGIDAVQRAWQYGFRVIWLTGSDNPVWLTGNRLPIHGVWEQHKDNPNGPMWFVKVGRARPTVRSSGNAVTVSFTPTGTNTPVEKQVSFYVIALGQNAMAPGAIGDVLKTGGITASHLEPIYDVNQIFGLPYQTALGLQLKGTRHDRGLQIIGAAASALAATYKQQGTAIAHDYLEQFPVSDKATLAEGQNALRADRYLKKLDVVGLLEHQVNPSSIPDALKAPSAQAPQQPSRLRKLEGIATPDRPATTAVSSVLVSAQLGGVRAAIAAMQGLMPGYIYEGGVDLSSDDRTMLAVYIARKYPHLEGSDIEEIVQFIIKERRTSQTHVAGSVLGFTDEVAQEIEKQLARLNEKRFFQK